MIIAFCGHSTYSVAECDEIKIMDILEAEIGDRPCEIFLGGYGNFDEFALQCGKKFKQKNPSVKIVLITPYLDAKKTKSLEHSYDSIIYPELENVPFKYAISCRNKWMVEKADILISFVSHQYGGAYTMYSYAKRKNKKIYNLPSIE